VHRDLKPENVFLVHNEDEEIAKVLDFGVAKVERHALSEGTRTRTGSILGTPFYMSPEQAQGNRTVDSRSDLWSMGVIAFECLTGKRPFYSDGLGDLVLAICVRDMPVPSEVASVPIGFDAWWQRAVARDPDKRFQSAKELTDALREALGLESRELRELPRAAPDIEVTSAPAPFEPHDPPPTDRMPGLSSSRILSTEAASAGTPGAAVQVRADERAEPDAATVVAPVPPAPTELPALTERQFGTTQKSIVSPRVSNSDGTGIVIFVAAAALFVGLLAGVMLLRAQHADAPDQKRALPAPLPVAVHQPSEPHVKSKPAPAPSASAASSSERPLLEFLPGDAPASGPSASASAAAPAPTSAPVEPRNAAPKPTAAAAAGSSATPAPSSSVWVKPEWAIPDDEPVRRAPIDEK